MPGENPFKDFQKKYEKKAENPDEGKLDDEGRPELEFSKKLPEFLDPSTPEPAKTANRESFKKFVGKDDAAFVPIIDEIYAGNTAAITPEQFHQFTEHVAVFKQKWEAAKNLSERLTDDMVERMAKQSNREAFGTYVYSYGAGTMGKIWREQIPHLIVDDESKFERLEQSINQYEEFEKLGSGLIKTRAAELGIKEGKYNDIMSEQDPQVRREKLRTAMDAKYDKAKNKLGKFWSYTERGAKKLAEAGQQELLDTVANMDEQLLAIGELLADATADNAEIQRAVLAAIA